jgi:hypothetical protein
VYLYSIILCFTGKSSNNTFDFKLWNRILKIKTIHGMWKIYKMVEKLVFIFKMGNGFSKQKIYKQLKNFSISINN